MISALLEEKSVKALHLGHSIRMPRHSESSVNFRDKGLPPMSSSPRGSTICPMRGSITSRILRPFVALVLLVATFQVASISVSSHSDAAAAGWQIQMHTASRKETASTWPSSARLTRFASPGTTSFPSATSSSTGASGRTTFGAGEGVYNAYFNQTGITKVAFVDGSSTSLDPTAHTNYLIYDLVESTGNESLYAILKRIDNYLSTATSIHGNDSVFGTASVLNLTAGTNGYSGTLASSGGTGFKTSNNASPTKFAVWGINRDSDNDVQTLAAYSGDLQTGKSDSWRGDSPAETFWSYWGGDFHTGSQTQRIGNAYLQTSPGVPTGASWTGNVYLLAYSASTDVTAPTFPSTETYSVAENQTSVGTITTSEAASIAIHGGADSNKFSLARIGDSSTALSFVTVPNFEAPTDVGANNVYDLVLKATDTSENIGYETLTVTVTNANDPPVITSNGGGATASISMSENSTSVTTVQATDQDSGATVTFSISGTDANDFAINSNSGAVTFLQTPDYEAPVDSDANNAYIIVVTASDSIATDSQTITINITDLNESAISSLPTVSGTLYKGVNTTISLTIDVSARVRFFVNDKRISTCKDRVTSGSYPNNVATCIWKPASIGKNYLSATITPTASGFSAISIPRQEVFVQKRTTLR